MVNHVGISGSKELEGFFCVPTSVFLIFLVLEVFFLRSDVGLFNLSGEGQGIYWSNDVMPYIKVYLCIVQPCYQHSVTTFCSVI